MPLIVDLSDGDLARAISAREPGTSDMAEGELYRRLAPRVRLYGLRHLRCEEAARDLVQQVMLLVIEKLRGGFVRDADQIASFALGTSRMMARDLSRREWRRVRLREALLATPSLPVPSRAESFDLDRLEACLGRLAERERAVVLSTFYAEKSAGEVGQELGVTEGNVRVIRHRAVQRLRACVLSREEVP